MANATPHKKKHRLSNLFKGKKEPEGSASNATGNGSNQASSSTNNAHPGPADSAYASSDVPSTSGSKSAEMVPVASNDDRNLAMNKSTGEVVDEDSGEVVTVTTTTTTTTTTRTRGGKPTTVQVATTPAGSTPSPAPVHEAPGDTPAASSSVQTQQHLSPNAALHPPPSHSPASSSSQSHSPQAPTGGVYSPQPQQYQQHNPLVQAYTPSHSQPEQRPKPAFLPYPQNRQQADRSPPHQQQGPPRGIPPRHPHRRSRELISENQQAPVSPVQPDGFAQHNFSYPSRSTGNLRGDDPSAPAGEVRQSNTFENLKAAAVGLHVSVSSSSSFCSVWRHPTDSCLPTGRRRDHPRHPQQRDRHPLPAPQRRQGLRHQHPQPIRHGSGPKRNGWSP
jgi:hypothetical protein